MCTAKELEFSVFVIHKQAAAWGKTPVEVYAVLNDTKILDEYLIPCYDTLHTMGSEAVTEELTDFVRERGVAV